MQTFYLGIVNPRHACTARVTVVWPVSLLIYIVMPTHSHMLHMACSVVYVAAIANKSAESAD